jgi:hypothetical protein
MREQIEIPKSQLTDRQLRYGEDPKVMFLILVVVVALSALKTESVSTFVFDLVFSNLPDSVIIQMDNFFDFFDTTTN